MNERIRELSHRAGFMVDTGMAEDKDTSEAFEKFAELIVQECMKINNQFIGHRIGEIDLDVVYKEHFGVK